MKIAINGAGIAGPTLAHWLSEAGPEVLLVEQAPAFRSGGYVIDFWGLGHDIAEKMGLGLRVRNLVGRLLGIPAVADYFIGRDLRDDIKLPDYRS